MKVYEDAVLTCSACGVEAEHELLYLSEHLRASRCKNCGETRIYSDHIYAEYLKDVFERTSRLPYRFADDLIRHPTALVGWSVKALKKPFSLIKEVGQLTSFERSRHSTTSRCRVEKSRGYVTKNPGS